MIDPGHDLESDILPVIRSRRGKARVRQWNYFTQRWRNWLTYHAKGQWLSCWGDPPGSEHCQSHRGSSMNLRRHNDDWIGRSLLNDPVFAALADQYRQTSGATALRRALSPDVVNGTWRLLKLWAGREQRAIDWIADHTGLPCYLPMRRPVNSHSRTTAGSAREQPMPCFQVTAPSNLKT